MSLLFALGAGQRRDDRPVELLTIFDIQPPRVSDTWVLFIAQFRHPVTKRWTPQS